MGRLSRRRNRLEAKRLERIPELGLQFYLTDEQAAVMSVLAISPNISHDEFQISSRSDLVLSKCREILLALLERHLIQERTYKGLPIRYVYIPI